MKGAKEEVPSPRPLLRRRDILALSSAGLLVPLVGDLAWAQTPGGNEAAGRPLSAGYIEGSEVFRDLHRLPKRVRRPLSVTTESETAEASPVVVPAASLFQCGSSQIGRAHV